MRRAVLACLGLLAACGGGGPAVEAVDAPDAGHGAIAVRLDAPAGIAALPGGGVAVADPPRHEVLVLSADGALVRRLGGEGEAPGRFLYPSGVAADSAGTLYVVDTFNGRVQRFAPDGRFLAAWGQIGSGDDAFLLPRAAAVSPAGEVHVADEGNHRIQVFDADGRYLRSLPSRGGDREARRPPEEGGGPLPGSWPRPRAVAFSAEGDLFVATPAAIHRVGAGGRPEAAWRLPPRPDGETATPTALAGLRDGRCLVADDAGRLLTFERDGRLGGVEDRFAAPPGVRRPLAGLAVVREKVWVADPTAGRVVRVDRPTAALSIF